MAKKVDVPKKSQGLQQIHSQEVSWAEWSPDGTTIQTGAMDGFVNVLDAQGNVERTAKLSGPITCMSISSDKQSSRSLIAVAITTSISIQTLRDFAKPNSQPLRTMIHRDSISSLSFLTHNLLCSAGRDRCLKLWEVDTGKNPSICRVFSPITALAT